MIPFDPFAFIYEKNRQDDARSYSRDRIDYRNIHRPRRRVPGAVTMTSEREHQETDWQKLARQRWQRIAVLLIENERLRTENERAVAEIQRLLKDLRNNELS